MRHVWLRLAHLNQFLVLRQFAEVMTFTGTENNDASPQKNRHAAPKCKPHAVVILPRNDSDTQQEVSVSEK
jgi:hypothetical protein